MVPALIALISLLFFGGSEEYFLIADLDKGVKKFVVEKETKKEVLSIFKIKTKDLKKSNKAHAKLIKEFGKVNLDRSSSKEVFEQYAQNLANSLKSNQDIIIDARINTIVKLSEEEWKNITTLSKETTQKRNAKIQKKLDKKDQKDPFAKIETSITESIIDESNRKSALSSLDQLRKSYSTIAEKLKDKNIIDTPALENKDTSQEDLEAMALYLRELRLEAYHDMLDFRFEILEQSNEMEWSKIMKSLNKLMTNI